MSDRIVNKTSFEKEISLEEYLAKAVDIYGALFYSRKKRLTDTELEVYVTYIINCTKGYKTTSNEALAAFNKTMGMKRKGDIHTYLRKISGKRWLKGERRGYTLPDMFKEIPDEFDFNIILKKISEIDR